MTALADLTDARFTDDQRATVARFEAAPTPPEVAEARVVEEVARALPESVGYPWPEGDGAWSQHEREHYRTLAAAAVAAYRAAQDGGAEEAVRRVSALAEELERDARTDRETVLWVTNAFRAALAPQAGDGAR